jgi:O-methyltransferase involved in polyketide biosynthesis
VLPGVSKTALLTLRARAEEHARPDRVFEDPVAAEWWSRVSWPAELDLWYGPRAQWPLAFRADDLDRIVRRYVGTSSMTIVELGCGLSTRRHRLSDLPIARWFDLDLPPVVELRRSWGAGEPQLAASVLDEAWMDQLDGDPSSHVFIAEGLFYYLPRAEVDRLFLALRRRFAGSVVLLDVLGAYDHAQLLENTRAVGTPIAWGFEGVFDESLGELGLAPVEGFEPDRLTAEATRRYWHRFDATTRGLIYFALHNELFKSHRSGNVLGRLAPL